MVSVDVHQHKEHKIDGGTLIVSVPGHGMGNILLTDFLLESLEMDSLASLRSEGFPPVAMVHGGKPRHPVRIHADPKARIAVLRSEFPAPPQLAGPMGLAIVDWAEEQGIEQIVVLDGVPAEGLGGRVAKNGDIPPVHFVASTDAFRKEADDEGLDEFEHGALGGLTAVLLLEGRARGIGVLSLLAALSDPMDDADSVRAFARVLPSFVDGLEIDEKALGRRLKEIHEAVRSVQEQAQRALHQLEDHHETEEDPKTAPSMYR